MEKLNHPEKANKWVHIAGTNGKGSTLTFVRNALEKLDIKREHSLHHTLKFLMNELVLMVNQLAMK